MDMAKVICSRVGDMGRSLGPGDEMSHELRSVQVRLWMEPDCTRSVPYCHTDNLCLFYLSQLLPEMSAIIRQYEAFEVENNRLRAHLGLN
jgi:hypothetical protein